MRRADKLTTFLCRCLEIWETTSWKPLGHSRSVTGLIYLYLDPIVDPVVRFCFGHYQFYIIPDSREVQIEIL